MRMSIPQKPRWPWQSTGSAVSMIAVAFSAAFLAVGFASAEKTNWLMVVLGSVFGVAGALFPKDGLFWEIKKYLADRNDYGKAITRRERVIMTIVSLCEKKIVDRQLVEMAQSVVDAVDVAYRVRRALLLTTHPLIEADGWQMTQLKGHVDSMYTGIPYDLTDVCLFMESLLRERETAAERGKYDYRIQEISALIERALQQWAAKAYHIDERGVAFCRELLSKQPLLPGHDNILRHLNSVDRLKQAADAVDSKGKL